MENYRMNYRSQMPRRMYSSTPSASNMSTKKSSNCTLSDMGLGHLPLAMAYVPYQKANTLYDCSKGLEMGTIFPELCKPFCGKGGKRKC